MMPARCTDLTVRLITGGMVTDEVDSYAGMRKISLGVTEDGFTRIFLNNLFVWQNGPLDQGFWPDGLYTPPSDEAMKYDIEMLKKMGFNMMRKHVKVENRRFYYHTDRLGMLVWQDMPSGDEYIWGEKPDITKSAADSAIFMTELSRMIDTRFNYPSIVMWVIYNEGWGQYNTAAVTDYVSAYDTTRLVNSASGCTDRGTGDVNGCEQLSDEPCALLQKKGEPLCWASSEAWVFRCRATPGNRRTGATKK
ncbi:MAG: glycoside hydrolase family 2 TIM barrel-domain containing protein [Bacteroidales bacterium]|nr:glycoside hydrolase family 2 TIM barrel-domain containing protein [Bacteroidales bacterium]